MQHKFICFGLCQMTHLRCTFDLKLHKVGPDFRKVPNRDYVCIDVVNLICV